MKTSFFLKSLFVFILLIFIINCSPFIKTPKLTPEEEDFLSKVRYIITKEEKKTFIELPPPERKKFIMEFWKKRDPDPTTEENEFKEMYLARVSEADKLFGGEGRPGWLTDRGRIYILFGPPTQIENFKGGFMDYQRRIYRDTIVWFYDYIPIIFVDKRGNGEFELDYSSIDKVNYLLSKLKDRGKFFLREGVFFDFKVHIKKDRSNINYLIIEIPYENLWFTESNSVLKTSLFLSLEIYDDNKDLIINFERDYPITLKEKELLKLKNKSFLINIPLIIGTGKYETYIIIKNTSSNEMQRKKLIIEIE